MDLLIGERWTNRTTNKSITSDTNCIECFRKHGITIIGNINWFVALLYRVDDPTPPAGLHQMNVGGVA
jgi:hypothetical protein